MVLSSNWGRIQPEIQIWPDKVVAGSRTLAGSPWKGAEMLSELRSPMTPSSPTTPYLLTGRSNRRVWGVKLVLFWVCWILLFQGRGKKKGPTEMIWPQKYKNIISHIFLGKINELGGPRPQITWLKTIFRWADEHITNLPFSRKNRGPPESPLHVPFPSPNAQSMELNWQ